MSAEKQHEAQDDEARESETSANRRKEIPEHSGQSSSEAALPPNADGSPLHDCPAIHTVSMLGRGVWLPVGIPLDRVPWGPGVVAGGAAPQHIESTAFPHLANGVPGEPQRGRPLVGGMPRGSRALTARPPAAVGPPSHVRRSTWRGRA